VRACVPAAVISTNNVFRLQMQAPLRGCRSSRLLLVVMEEGIGHQAPQQVTNLAVNCDHILKFVLVSNRSSYVCTVGTGCLICIFRILGSGNSMVIVGCDVWLYLNLKATEMGKGNL